MLKESAKERARGVSSQTGIVGGGLMVPFCSRLGVARRSREDIFHETLLERFRTNVVVMSSIPVRTGRSQGRRPQGAKAACRLRPKRFAELFLTSPCCGSRAIAKRFPFFLKKIF
jgi:hypothetical protein